MLQLATPTRDQVVAVRDWLAVRHNARRPPEIAARILLTIVDYYQNDVPLPPRERLARKLGLRRDTVDQTIQAAVAGGELEAGVVVTPRVAGAVGRFKRTVIPSADLLSVVAAAKKAHPSVTADGHQVKEETSTRRLATVRHPDQQR
jgi:hypothetical protein